MARLSYIGESMFHANALCASKTARSKRRRSARTTDSLIGAKIAGTVEPLELCSRKSPKKVVVVQAAAGRPRDSDSALESMISKSAKVMTSLASKVLV